MGKHIASLDVIKARNGQLTARVTTMQGRRKLLHSQYDPQKEARDWLDSVALTPHTAYIVLGFGLGYHVKALLEKLPLNSHVFVVECSAEENLFRAAADILGRPKWMSDKRLDCLLGGDLRDVAATINKTMQKQQIKKVTLCRHFPTMHIFGEFFSHLENHLVSKVEELFSMDYNYRLTAADVVIKQAWNNLPEICTGSGIAWLKDAFKGKPAIMVAGGPSLNKNIDIVKKYADHAVVVCAGSTMGALHHHDIKPHFLLAIDPFEYMEKDLDGVVNDETYLVAPYFLADTLVDKYPGPKLFCRIGENSPNINVLDGIRQYLPPTEMLHSNVSVAMSAVCFAVHLGCNPIILVGQDLAFGSDMAYSATGSKAVSLLDPGKKYEEYISIPGYYGDTVKTILIFKEAVDWYNSYFNMTKDVKFINATEGGAFLPGADHISMSEAAEKYLQHRLEVFAELKAAVPTMPEENYKELLAALWKDSGELKALKEQGLALLAEVDDCPKRIAAGEDVQARQDLDKISAYIKKVSSSAVYIHMVPYLHVLMELFAFKSQDGYRDLEDEFLNYATLYGHVQGAVNELYNLVTQGAEELEKQLDFQPGKRGECSEQ